MARRDRKPEKAETCGKSGLGSSVLRARVPGCARSLQENARKPPLRAVRPLEHSRDPEEEEDDTALFLAAVSGARRIEQSDSAARLPPPPPVAGVQRARSALLDRPGGTELEFVSGEDPDRLEGWLRGLDPKVLRRLRAGEFPHPAELDLHGLTLPEAREAVRSFLLRALRARHRCVLIVHGRGHHSPGRHSPLREHLREWLLANPLAAAILAFVPAQPRDGGDGALYVLLRRTRRP
jgi:DNA-nicking Smr family endonuclease